MADNLEASLPPYEDFQRNLLQLADIAPATDEYDQAVDSLLNNETLIQRLQTLLKVPVFEGYNGPTVAAQLIADMAKAENTRLVMCKQGIISLLLPLLSCDNHDLCIQVIRALGNLCYEQDACREEIVNCGGIEIIGKLLKVLVSLSVRSESITTPYTVFVHNLLNGNELCINAVLKTDLLESLKTMLELDALASPKMAKFCILIFTSVAEVEGGREVLCKLEVPSLLVKVLINTPVKPADDAKDVILSLLSVLTADFDEVKLMLANSAIDMYLLRIISTLSPSEVEDDIELVKSASELIVLVLTGDEAMNIWFDGGDGFVFTSVSEWLQSNNGQLLQSAAFALGNFARDDRNSHIIIQRGISSTLCKCLDQLHPVCSDDRTAPTVHALLSALRNLAIAPKNKVQLLEQGVMKHILPYMDSENSIVSSKLVGVIRLLIDKQEKEAKLIGSTDQFVEKLVSFGDSESNALLKGESIRCLAWLIKTSQDKQVLQNMVKCGAFKHLVYLVKSEHRVMQNEGLISLVLLSNTLPDESRSLAHEQKLSQAIVELLDREELAEETVLNTLTLIIKLLTVGLVDELLEVDISSVIDRLKAKSTYKNEEKKIEELISAIKSTLRSSKSRESGDSV